jgi:uncharacterized protein YcfL
MNNMKRVLVVAVAFMMVVSSASAFAPFGHQTIAALADKYLTDKAKSEVQTILQSDMIKHSVWLNSLRKKEGMEHTKDWHFFVLDANGKSITTNENDGVVQLEKAIDVLRNRANHSAESVNTALKTVIHLVGDIHCLSHIHIEGVDATKGFEFKSWNELEGKERKEWASKWYNIWERTYINRYTFFSPQYYANDIDIYACEKRNEYETGTPRFWAENSGEDVMRALPHFNTGEPVPTNVIQRYEYNHTKCMAKAAYRLAALLNDIFK